MKVKMYFSVLAISIAMLFAAIPVQSLAADTEAVEAEIMDVYGGADGIISMTFDDGYYATALVLDELLAKYDLKASVMMIANSINTAQPGYGDISKFTKLFSTGRLEPQSHSMTHQRLTEDAVSPDNEYELYKSEISDSKTLLENIFPENDIVAFATPYGSMSANAVEFASKHYYAIRTTQQGVQTLNPASDAKLGGWYAMYSPVTYRNSFDSAADPEATQWNWIKKCIDDAANGWYIPITHRVGDVEGAELSYKMADKMFAYIASLRDEGKVWVTTYSEAVKYVRERQNSTVSAYFDEESIFVDVKMTGTTDDGLPLGTDVFNVPLTVKIEVPADYSKIYYTNAGKEYITEAFSQGSKNYVYVNVSPNSGPVKLRFSSTHDFGEWSKYDEEVHERTCLECGFIDYSEHVWDDGEITITPTHTKTGTKKCTCLMCGDDEDFKVKKTDDHTFDRMVESMNFKASDATCVSGEKYYYSCVCGACGTETFDVGEPLGHSFGEWKVVKEPTAVKTGLKARECGCGECEYEEIEPLGNKPGISTPVLIGIIAGSLGIGVVVILVVLLKKRKA